jgi:hypothetical protein
MNKNISKQFISTFDPNKINKSRTLLDNEKKEILKKLTNSISNRKVLDSIHSAIELHSSGYIDIVLKKLFNYYYSEINTAQPQCIKYIDDFNKYYRRTYDCKIKSKQPITLVNDMRIRNFLCFFTPLILMCNQRKLLKLAKISPPDFNMDNHKKYLVSKDLTLVAKFISKKEPKEIIIPLSEICNYLSEPSLQEREQKIIFWLSWLLEYEKVYHNKNLLVDVRDIDDVDSKYHRDFVWILWAMIKHFKNNNNKAYIEHLYSLFIDNYSRGTKKSKANIIIIAVLFIINPMPRISYPVLNLTNDQFKQSNLHSLKANNYYLKLFQNKTYSEV